MYGERLVALAKKHSSEAFYGCDDPLEAVVFSVLVEMFKQQEERNAKDTRKEAGVREDRDVDP